jgi:hypothetical protein
MPYSWMEPGDSDNFVQREWSKWEYWRWVKVYKKNRPVQDFLTSILNEKLEL